MNANRKTVSLRLKVATYETLKETIHRAGYKTRTALIEKAILEYCAYLNENHQDER